MVTQRALDQNLKWGITFSALWLMGIGSLVSVVLGFRARKVIKDSDGALNGLGRAWWCLIVGGLGVVFGLPIAIVGIMNQF